MPGLSLPAAIVLPLSELSALFSKSVASASMPSAKDGAMESQSTAAELQGMPLQCCKAQVARLQGDFGAAESRQEATVASGGVHHCVTSRGKPTSNELPCQRRCNLPRIQRRRP